MQGIRRYEIRIRGAVQGVGFRPFVYNLAHSLQLAGQIRNDNRGVELEIEGQPSRLADFLHRLESELPPRAEIHQISKREISAIDDCGFEIVESESSGRTSAIVLPDLATCDECLAEVLDPKDRRYRYAFTNCTNCGPRFSIIEDLPYDRPGTTMRSFEMCALCSKEYRDPLDRRFHAQPNACPACGPQLSLLDGGGGPLAAGYEALLGASALLEEGGILAAKGLGGFHLMVQAGDEIAVAALRERKHRPHKPLALMARDLEMVESFCQPSEASSRLLCSPESPIVLLPRREDIPVADNVAPGIRELGVMLPPTPMHHLLMALLAGPIVATSGNLSDEPICIDNDEALQRLGGIADRFLMHDRPIARHVDDSVVRWIDDGPSLMRRARGYAPFPILLRREVPTLLAVGPHLKCTVALSVGDRVFMSQHIGDMETTQARAAFERVTSDLIRLYEARPEAIVHDLHPDYPTTHWALRPFEHRPEAIDLSEIPRIAVQHHHAHLASCLAEHGLENEECLGMTWDGTGYGTDGTIWGGEFLLGSAADFRRVAHLRTFRLPGGEAAIQEPRRSALSLVLESGLEPRELMDLELWTPEELRLFEGLLRSGLNSPITSSAGRLFDGVACLIGLRPYISFEGQAAIELEQIIDPDERGSYSIELVEGNREAVILDWAPMIEEVLHDSRRGVSPGIMATRFHHALAGASVAVAKRVGASRIALTGGCFQNRFLTECTRERLGSAGFRVLLHRKVPANDGGVSLGQIAVAAARLEGRGQGDKQLCV